MTKEIVSKKSKTRRVERTRTHYARSHGDLTHVRVDEPLAVDLELPASYVQDLCASLRRSLSEGDDFEQVEIAVDVPVRIWLRPLQVEQLVEKLAEISR